VAVKGLRVIRIVGMIVTEDTIATLTVVATLLVVALPSQIVLLAGRPPPSVETTAMEDEEGAIVDPLSVVHQGEAAIGTGVVVQKEVTEEEIEMIGTIGMIGTTGTTGTI
jgi:hypothetical protein